MSQLAGAAEYIDCISAEGLDSCNECSRYDTKFDGEALVLLELWECRELLHFHHYKFHFGREK